MEWNRLNFFKKKKQIEKRDPPITLVSQVRRVQSRAWLCWFGESSWLFTDTKLANTFNAPFNCWSDIRCISHAYL